MEKRGKTGNAHADGFIFSFLKGAQAEDRARPRKEAAARGGSPASWAGGRVSPKPAASDRPGGRGFREHKYEHFLFLLKELEKENF